MSYFEQGLSTGMSKMAREDDTFNRKLRAAKIVAGSATAGVLGYYAPDVVKSVGDAGFAARLAYVNNAGPERAGRYKDMIDHMVNLNANDDLIIRKTGPGRSGLDMYLNTGRKGEDIQGVYDGLRATSKGLGGDQGIDSAARALERSRPPSDIIIHSGDPYLLAHELGHFQDRGSIMDSMEKMKRTGADVTDELFAGRGGYFQTLHHEFKANKNAFKALKNKYGLGKALRAMPVFASNTLNYAGAMPGKYKLLLGGAAAGTAAAGSMMK